MLTSPSYAPRLQKSGYKRAATKERLQKSGYKRAATKERLQKSGYKRATATSVDFMRVTPAAFSAVVVDASSRQRAQRAKVRGVPLSADETSELG
jgi:hypothetical protein